VLELRLAEAVVMKMTVERKSKSEQGRSTMVAAAVEPLSRSVVAAARESNDESVGVQQSPSRWT
jgi:hypothetical protein